MCSSGQFEGHEISVRPHHLRQSIDAVVTQSQFQVLTHRSLYELVYRVIDSIAILSMILVAARYSSQLPMGSLLTVSATILLSFGVAAEISGLYRSWRGSRLLHEIWCVVISWIYTSSAVLGLGMLSQYNAWYSYESKLVWLFATPMALAAARMHFKLLLRVMRKHGFNTQRVAICGINKLGLQLAENIEQSPELGMNLLGLYDDRPESRTEQAIGQSIPHSGDLIQLVDMAQRGIVDIIYITFPMRAEKRIRNYLELLSDSTASVYIVPDFFVFQMLHARWNQINGMPVVSVFETPIRGIDGVLKRGFDLIVATVLLVLLAVPMAILGMLIKFTSPGPVFFRQTRYGLSGEKIRVWKFRSMHSCDNGPMVHQATVDDSRITPIGRIIRKTSIDELPQLFNVIDGSMSLVGPRPHAAAHNEQYRPLIHGYMLRHKVKPGITGLAQVNGWRGETETIEKMEGRIECDHRYIREWSLWMDIKILFKTAQVVIRQENAY
jgi:putative colanic acid biosynthesis UDP-glucose lipid carrier transferase